MDEKNTTRIDKWLWAVRIYKTRSISTEACANGKVKIDGNKVKASRMIKVGEMIQVRKGLIKFDYRDMKITEKRMGAKFVKDHLNDLTPKEELAKLIISKDIQKYRGKNRKGRPTKKARRIIDKFREYFDKTN